MGVTPDEVGRLILPSAEYLCSAIRGHHVAAHRVTRIAAGLGRLYQRGSSARAPRCCCGRGELVLAIDTWVAEHLPVPHPDARLHTETVGAVIDRLARTQVYAYRLLMTVDNVADPQVHAAWYRLAELVDGYTDLNTSLSQRSLRLPALGDGA
ncbi:DUF4254 domain-containing protein [Nocardia sp. NPDC005366]|uniref:DUF4254 domain-containing protein n=1 Tax=Nocardia sp. NPDC005366 TaxID=3156878 RepID=UPI0033AC40CF